VIYRKVAEALEADEHVVALRPSLQQAQDSAWRLLAASSPASPEPFVEPAARTPVALPVVVPQHPRLQLGDFIVDERAMADLNTDQAMGLLDELRRRVESEPTATLTISWRLTKASGAA